MEFTEEDYYELFDEYCDDCNAYHTALYSIMESVFERLEETESITSDTAYKAAMEQLDNEVIYYSDCENIITSYGLSKALDTFNEWQCEMGGDLDLTNLAIAVLQQNLPSMDEVIDLYNEKLEEEEEEEEE